MKKHTLKLAIAASAMTMLFAGCGDDVLVSEEVAQSFSTVESIDPDDCNSKSEGSMAFVKKTSTMYVCTDGEWVALNDQDAIEYRCSTKQVKKNDKTGLEIICDGETIGTVYNGEDGENGAPGKNGKNGENGDSVDMDELNDAINKSISKGLEDVSEDLSKQLSDASAKNKKDLDKQLDEATDEMSKDLDSKLSSASAKHDKDVDDLDKKLSSASAKSKKDNKEISDKLDDVNDKLSSASKNQEDLDKKLSSLADEYDKSCKLNDEPIISEDGKTVTVSVKCGTAEKTFVANLDDENLKNVYKKHVVVRLPVQTEKTTSSEDVYEEIWKSLKGGKHTELTVVDLDEKLNATGKMFVTDLFADATKKGAFVTVEETNTKAIEYKVVRLEGDIEVTNLSTPIVQLRVKLNLENPASWAGAATFTDVIYTAITDLSDESETVVIDFLTDYKAERVKYLVQKNGEKFVEASADANAQLAAALSLVKEPSELEAFEHYLPGSEGVGLNEYFNSIVWVMALIDQSRKVPNFNKIYNEYRKVFAEQGSFNKAIETTYNGIEQSLFFVDYLALLINANFYKWNCAMEDGYLKPWKLSNGECETYEYSREDEVYYKLIQDGFVSTYGLDVDKAEPYGEGYKLQKYEFEYGYFHYFVYDEAEKIWYPLEDIATIIKLEGAGDCDADKAAAHTTVHFRKDGLDNTYECKTTSGDRAEWVYDENVCNGREEGKAVTYYNRNNKLVSTTCKNQCYDSDGSPTSETTDHCQMIPADDPYYVGEQVGRAKNGKSIDEILNPAEGEGPLGKCGNAENPVGTIKSFDEMDAERSTTTGHAEYMCNGKKWVKASPVDLYCVGDKVQPTEQKISDEDLAELGMQFDQKCKYEDVQYVRNTAGSAQWLDPTEYIREVYGEAGPRRINGARIVDRYVDGPVGLEEALVIAAKTIRDSLYVYMNGYRDNAVYKCVDEACEKLSNDAITSTINKFRDEKGGKEYFTSMDSLSIFCNMAEYKKVKASTGYLDADIAYEVELGDDATGKTKYVAYAARNNWREFKLSDVLGTCDADKMVSQTKLSKYGDESYKCDCEYSYTEQVTIEFNHCEWTPATEREVTLDGKNNAPCTVKLAIEKEKTNSKDNKYYCDRVAIPGTNMIENNWKEMTVQTWCERNAKYIKGKESCQSNYENACAVCADVPESVEGHGITYIRKSISSGTTSFITAEDYFGTDCSEEPKFIMSLVNEDNVIFEYSDNTGAYADDARIHDFVCRDGHLVEATDADEACRAADINQADICTYMHDPHEYVSSHWKPLTCNFLKKAFNEGATIIDTKDRVCTAADNTELYKAENRGYCGICDDNYENCKYFDDKWYSVKDYCAKLDKYCYKAGSEPEGQVSSISCVFVELYEERETFICNQTKGEWVKKTAEEYCNEQLKAATGMESCSVSNVQAYCSSAAGQNDPSDCKTSFTFFNFQCELPEGLLYEGQQNMRCDYDWECNGSDDDYCIRWGFSA